MLALIFPPKSILITECNVNLTDVLKDKRAWSPTAPSEQPEGPVHYWLHTETSARQIKALWKKIAGNTG